LAGSRKRFWLTVGLLTAAVIYRHLLWPGPAPTADRADLKEIPRRIGRWQGVDETLEERVLEVLGLDAYLQRRYLDPGGHMLWLYIGYYLHQRQGKGIHSPRHCYPGAGWSIVEKGVEEVRLQDPDRPGIRAHRIIFQREGTRQVVLYWFQSTDRIVHSEYAQRFYMVLDAVWKGRTDGALVKVSAPVQDDVGSTLERLKDFVRESYPFIHRALSDD
jgi:EpsI family protein